MTAVTGQTSPRSVTEPLPGRGHSQTDKQQCLRSDFWKQSLSHSAWTPSLISQCYFEVSYSANVDVNVWWFGIGVRFLHHCGYQISNICTILKCKCWPFHYLFYFSVLCIIIIFLYVCFCHQYQRELPNRQRCRPLPPTGKWLLPFFSTPHYTAVEQTHRYEVLLTHSLCDSPAVRCGGSV